MRWVVVGASAAAAVAVLAAAVRRSFVAVTVIGESMEPSLTHGARILVRRGGRRPQVGDVVVLRPVVPDAQRDPGLVVKRVAAVGGDVVPPSVAAAAGAAVGDHLPHGHVAVLGDNPAASYDSRMWGLVDERLLVGRSVLRLLDDPDAPPDPVVAAIRRGTLMN
jgi:signal peptidase I